MLHGLMMNTQLTISSLLVHADKYHGDTEIVSRPIEPDLSQTLHRTTYRALHGRAQQCANALVRLGIQEGDRVGTLAWNGYRHMELYFAISGMGAVTHTINPRLFVPQIAWIINHADDQALFFDLTFAPIVAQLVPLCPRVKHWVAMTDTAHMPAIDGALCYETLIQPESPHYAWPALNENAAASLCYTSGTTGNPKGVLYSHRSTVIHAFAAALPDVMALSSREVVLPVVPMFHVNAWGIPYAAAMTGVKLVMPGAGLDGASLYQLFEQEKVTLTAGVPTVWLGVLQHLQKNGLKLSTVTRMVVGGAACPPALMDTFKNDYNIQMQHAWGMSELSPIGSYGQLKHKHDALSASEQRAILLKQGRPPYGIDLQIVDSEGKEQARDGIATGDLMARGVWVVQRYFGADADATDAVNPSWFATGDVASLDPDGYVHITDRSKDVIKSGGEWISSIELENLAMAHPAVAEAAAIGMKHEKWDERPLLIVVRKPDTHVSKADILQFMDGKIAKWWLPDDVVFVNEIPHTATGKILKTQLRVDFKDYIWPTA